MTRFEQHVEAGFRQMETRFAELRMTVTELGSDATFRENRSLTRHDDILAILRRLDVSEVPGEPGEEE